MNATYKGFVITKTKRGFVVMLQPNTPHVFPTLERATLAIDSTAV